MDGVIHKRTVRSFVRRDGRSSPTQKQAIADHWSSYGIDCTDQTLDLNAIFGRTAACHLEIGFGAGELLFSLLSRNPDDNFLGIEVHRPGVGQLISQASAAGLGNLRIISLDAVEVLKKNIPDEAFDFVYIFFSDPWHKTKHHKRRLIQPEFINLLRKKLKPGGHLYLATDWQNYAEQMLRVLNDSEGFENVAADAGYSERPDFRPLTKFEKRGHRLGHGVWDLHFIRSV